MCRGKGDWEIIQTSEDQGKQTGFQDTCGLDRPYNTGNLHAKWKVQPGSLAALRTDTGTEFTNAKVRKLLKEMSIKLELAKTDIHEHNGRAERYNRTHQNKISALLFDAGFPNTF